MSNALSVVVKIIITFIILVISDYRYTWFQTGNMAVTLEICFAKLDPSFL